MHTILAITLFITSFCGLSVLKASDSNQDFDVKKTMRIPRNDSAFKEETNVKRRLSDEEALAAASRRADKFLGLNKNERRKREQYRREK